MRATALAIVATAATAACGGRFIDLSAGDPSASGAAAATGGGVANGGAAAATGGGVAKGGAANTGSSSGAASTVATPATALCSNRPNERPGHLALLGQIGSQIVFIDDQGSARSVDGPGGVSVSAYQERNGWVAAYANPTPTTWGAELFDASGQVRAAAGGALPTSTTGSTSGVKGLRILSDGTALVYVGTGVSVLAPDGHVLVRPSFWTDPDARGWVGATLPSDTLVLGTPVMLNVPSGETRRLSLLAPNDEWAPIVAGSRHLYLAEMSGTVVLVDESVDGVHIEPLPGWARSALEVDTVNLANGGVAAYVGLWDGVRHGVPLWLYDVGTQTLASALPDGTVPSDATGILGGERGILGAESVSVSTGGARAWTVDIATGAIFDYRAGLSVRSTRPPAGGPPDWLLLTDNLHRVYRYDRNNGILEDLGLWGDASISGPYALVMQDGRPQASLRIDSAATIAIDGSALARATYLSLTGQWAVGFALTSSAGSFGASPTPAWRVDLETGETRLFPPVDPALTALGGFSAAPLFSAGAVPVLTDGSVANFLSDGFGAGLYVGAPDSPWRMVGRAMREVNWLGWAGGPSFAISAERDCHCYTPITVSWKPLPDGSSEILRGSSLQFVANDGTELFPPTSDEHLGSFSDASHSCALTRSDAGEWAAYDLAARTRRALGHFDQLAWVLDAP